MLSGGAGVLASKIVRKMGGGDVLSSLVGTGASAYTTYQLNQQNPDFANDNHERRAKSGGYGPSGFESMGEISFHRNGEETHIALVDIDDEMVHQNIETLYEILDAQEKGGSIFDYTPDVPEEIEQVVAILKDLGRDLEEIEEQLTQKQARKKVIKKVTQIAPEESGFPAIYEQISRSDRDVSDHHQEALNQTLEVLEARRQQIETLLEDPSLSQRARGYLVALQEVTIDVIQDIWMQPMSYGVAVAEVIPFGIGTTVSVGHQGYDVYQGTQTVMGGAGTLAVEGVAGIVGAKAVKFCWKGVKTFGAKVIQKAQSNNYMTNKIIKENGFKVVKQADTGIVWGKGNKAQGDPWEDYLAKSLPEDARLPVNYKTFDFHDIETKLALSAKTLDTSTAVRIADPRQVYNPLKKYVDQIVKFKEHKLSKVEITSEMITTRRMELAVPHTTNPEQWGQLMRAMEYGKSKGIEFNITVVK